MGKIKLTINGRIVEAEEGSTILEAARINGIHIPTLCFLKGICEKGACRVCQVEVEGVKNLCASCVYPIREGMVVHTHSKAAIEARKTIVELIMSNHSKDCLSCIRNQNCELQKLCEELGVRTDRFAGEKTAPTLDEVSPGIVRDTSKCVLCGRCIETCRHTQGLGILNFMERGFNTKVGPVFDKSLADVNCMQCGQCVNACPVGALFEKEEIHQVIDALNDTKKHVIVQTAPAVRASLGEEFGLPIGTNVTGKMVAALKFIGFERVYDTNFGADLTIMEEGYEFIDRLTNGGVLPMITSCSPGWINYCETEYPEILDHLSSCKSPHMMLGAIVKSYYAQQHDLDPKDIYVVSIMPCVAKKGEKERPQMIKDDIKDVDAVLTTRELGRLIKMYGIDFNTLKDEAFDQDLFGEYTGAGVIFGASGGVMEAALRTVVDVVGHQDLEKIDYQQVRGVEGLKEATIKVNDLEVRVAVAQSMQVAKPILDQIKAGTSPYHFIEVMGCPGGCINGGGQSYVSAKIKNSGLNYKSLRAKVLYSQDASMTKRKSHQNQQVLDLYKNFLKEPNSHLAHELLHTTYTKKPRYR